MYKASKLEITKSANKILDEYITCLGNLSKFPVFEYSLLYIYGSLCFKREVFLLSEDDKLIALIYRINNEAGLFAPLKLNDEIIDFVESNFGKIVQIRNFLVNSQPCKYLSERKWNIQKRSEEEAIYELKLTLGMEGSNFRNLRRNRKRLIDSDLIKFEPLLEENIFKVEEFIEIWRKKQGFKYSNDKTNKDLNILTTYAKTLPKNCHAYIAFLNGKQVGYSCSEINNKGAITLLIKGINVEPGTNGVTDAIYIKTWEMLSKEGVGLVNDGALGTEIGTSSHKKSFKPVAFIDTYEATK